MSDYPLYEFKMVADYPTDLEKYVTADKAWDALGQILQHLRSIAKLEHNGRGANLNKNEAVLAAIIYEDISAMMPKLND